MYIYILITELTALCNVNEELPHGAPGQYTYIVTFRGQGIVLSDKWHLLTKLLSDGQLYLDLFKGRVATSLNHYRVMMTSLGAVLYGTM